MVLKDKVLSCLKKNSPLTVKEISHILNVDKPRIYNVVNNLEKEGQAIKKQIGPNYRGRNQHVWRLLK